MYNVKDLGFVGKHDYDEESAKRWDRLTHLTSFSIAIFPWVLKANKKEMKPGKTVVRVHGKPGAVKAMLKEAEIIVNQLDAGIWDNRKNVFIK